MNAYLPTATSLLLAGLPYRGNDISIRGIEVVKTMAGLDAAYNNDFETPYTIHLNLGVQREIIRNLSVSADYVMRRGVHFGAFELFFPTLTDGIVLAAIRSARRLEWLLRSEIRSFRLAQLQTGAILKHNARSAQFSTASLESYRGTALCR